MTISGQAIGGRTDRSEDLSLRQRQPGRGRVAGCGAGVQGSDAGDHLAQLVLLTGRASRRRRNADHLRREGFERGGGSSCPGTTVLAATKAWRLTGRAMGAGSGAVTGAGGFVREF
jgi:hypothetical protein